MSTATLFPKNSRVVWKSEERRFLAQRVARSLIRRGVDLMGADDREVGVLMIPPLREAVMVLEPSRQRYIAGPAQVDWLIPMMREMVRCTRGESYKFPATILDEPKPAVAPYYAPENVEEPDGDWKIPHGFSLVETLHWEWLNDELRRVIKVSLRNRAKIAELTNVVESMNDHLTTLTELILEKEGKARPETLTPVAPSSPVRTNPLPLIVVAGVHPKDQGHVLERASDLAEIVFHDANRRDAERVGECDWIIMTTQCPGRFKNRALSLYTGKCSIVTNWKRAAEEVARLRRDDGV